ncbi:hypothetical protein BWK47_16080 [Synechocystis sp. CACIAM 05]|nr:hypothetical protein BWK47_16080 [Synechocystis sp. CACIAM 05]
MSFGKPLALPVLMPLLSCFCPAPDLGLEVVSISFWPRKTLDFLKVIFDLSQGKNKGNSSKVKAIKTEMNLPNK